MAEKHKGEHITQSFGNPQVGQVQEVELNEDEGAKKDKAQVGPRLHVRVFGMNYSPCSQNQVLRYLLVSMSECVLIVIVISSRVFDERRLARLWSVVCGNDEKRVKELYFCNLRVS
ncbi:hypothetical protein CEXT_763511 [Caerostris extrusa]|uniref:Uncharacterized protein n=1 Tax=Caerostris extrusa TaxID=172846 RepID=A0AAV4TCE1_CAEEX|nr:hypothetical protein CEXT_763511 [Caerostris extrusa]